MALLVSNLALRPDHSEEAPLEAALRRLRLREDQVKGWGVLRHSVDVRKRGEPRIVYSVYLELRDRNMERRLADKLARKQVVLHKPEESWTPSPGPRRLEEPVAVIGAGPAGLAAAWRLAESGYRPVVLERGGDVGTRVGAMAALDRKGQLDSESNYCFGAGGAGCFSDGKLHTRRNDFRAREFIELLVDCGAPDALIQEGRPHVGSDRLPAAVRSLCEKIERKGGRVRQGARVTGMDVQDGRLRSLILDGGEKLEVGACVIAPGGSARDTFAMLLEAGVELEARPLQMGLRLECSQDEIDELLYGRWAGRGRLGAAEFFLKSAGGGDYPAAHTFCMCPGGIVVPVATEPGYLSTNGVSRRSRASGFANAAVVTSVPAAESPLAGIELQRRIEKAVFEAGGSDYSFPCCSVADFMEDREPKDLPDGPKGVRRRPARLTGLLPEMVEQGVRHALERFSRIMPPLGGGNACLYAAETRVGSPVRITRDDRGLAAGIDNLYPAGEGSGYSAGIMSSAIDGMKAAENLIAVFAQP